MLVYMLCVFHESYSVIKAILFVKSSFKPNLSTEKLSGLLFVAEKDAHTVYSYLLTHK